MTNATKLEALVDVLFGDQPESVLEAMSGDQRVRFGHFSRIAKSLREPREALSAELKQNLMAIWPETSRRSLRVSLLGTTRGFAAARGATSDLQAEYSLDADNSLRVVATREGEHWHVMGKLSHGEWTVFLGDAEVVTEGGRFEFHIMGELPVTLSGFNAEEQFEVELGG